MRRPAYTSPLIPALLLLAALGWGCSSSSFGGKLLPDTMISWPPGVDEARVEVLYTYSGSAKPGGEEGFLSALSDWITGSEEIHFVSPYGMALASNGALIVADAGLGGVHEVDLEERTHKLYMGSESRPMETPIGVAVGPRGRIYVTDSTACCVHILSPEGDSAGTFGDSVELGRPTGIAYDATRDRILITDTTGGRILSFAPDGTLLETFGDRGDAQGQFNYPTNIAVDKRGRIFVVDTMNFRVQVLSPEFEAEHAFGLGGDGPGTFARPKGIALDSDGHVYVVDALFDNIQIFTEEGDLLLTVGARGTGFGGFFLPSGILIDDSDQVFISDAGNARIQALRYRSTTP